MSYRYTVRPSVTGNRYQGQPAYLGTKSTEEVIAAVQAKIGTQPLTVDLVVRTLHEVIIDLGIHSWRIEPLHGLVGYLFGCGGSEESPEFAPTYDNLNVALRGFLGQAGEDRARGEFSAEKVGDAGRVVPVIVGVLDLRTRVRDHYTPGAPLEVSLQNNRVKFEPGNGAHGIYLKAANGTSTKLLDTAIYPGPRLVGTVPAGLTGPQEVSVIVELNGGTRTGIYSFVIQP